MARTPSPLYSVASVPTSKTEVISAETATTRILRKITFINTSGATLTVDLYLDPTGAVEVQLLDTKAIQDQETWSTPDGEGHILNASGTMDVQASGAGLEMIVSGIKVT